MGEKEPQLGIFHEDSDSGDRLNLVQLLANVYHDNSKQPILSYFHGLHCLVKIQVHYLKNTEVKFYSYFFFG